MARKVHLSQAEFDEAVITNIQDFDMEPDEAVSSAIKEFELQGYSLEGIIKSTTGGNTDSHPIAVATRVLKESSSETGLVAVQDLSQAVTALQQQFKGLAGDDLSQAIAVASKEGSVAALLAALQAGHRMVAAGPAGSNSSNAGHGKLQGVVIPGLQCLRLLMQSPSCRSSLLTEGGAELVQQLLQDCCRRFTSLAITDGPQQQDDALQECRLAAAAAALAEAGAWQDEEAKFMDMGLAAGLLELLQLLVDSHGQPLSQMPQAAAAAGAAAGALRAFATADDDRPPASKAFLHSRLLAGKPNNALQVLLLVLKQLQQQQPRPLGPLISVLGAIRQIAANDEICKGFGEAGGVAALQQLLGAAAEEGPPELVRAVTAALRQLANSDAVKSELAEGGALATLIRATRIYGSHPAVQEQLLGLLVALVFGVGASGSSSGDAGSAAGVQRQACMAVRNMVVRNPELGPAFLAAGAEELLRSVKVLFPGSCKDVGSAALRDLGLDNYN
eukprot:gene12080-12220_t